MARTDPTDAGLRLIVQELGRDPGLGANAIMRRLHDAGVSFRRTEALSAIRELRGKPAPASPVPVSAARRGGYASAAARTKSVEKVRRIRSEARRASEQGDANAKAKQSAYEKELLKRRVERTPGPDKPPPTAKYLALLQWLLAQEREEEATEPPDDEDDDEEGGEDDDDSYFAGAELPY